MTVTAGPAFLPSAPAPAPEGTAAPTDPGEVLFRRYLAASVHAPATVVAGVRVGVRGTVRVANRWLPFRAVASVTPGHGFTRVARLGGLLAVRDVAVPGEILHRVALGGRVLREDGDEDVRRRAVGDLALATAWAPAVLASRADVRRAAVGADLVHVAVPAEPGSVLPPTAVGGAGVTLRLHRRGLPVAVHAARWGDPTGGQRPDWFPFGGPVLEHRTWARTTVPSTGVLGWFPGTERWSPTLRWQLTTCEPLGAAT